MANTKSAKKFIKKSRNRQKYNSSNRSKLRTFIKKLNIAINDKDQLKTSSLFPVVQKIIDHQISKGLIHKNKAARYISSSFKKIKSINS